MGQGDEKSSLKPIKPLALRYNDTRRTLKWYKEQLRLKMRRSRLLILAIADKLNEKELEVVKIKQEADLKLSHIWHQLLLLQGNLSKEQLRLSQLLQDKENIIQSQRQEISKLRLALEVAEKANSVNQQSKLNNGSFRRAKRERSSVTKNPQHTSSTEDSSSSPSSTPKPRLLNRQLSNDNKESSDKQSKELLGAGVGLTRQNKFIKGSERPKLKCSSNTMQEESKSPRGILKPLNSQVKPVQMQIKPPVPSRSKVNEKLKCVTSSDDQAGRRFTNYRGFSNRDSGNSSLDSSDPSSSLEWKLSVRSTIPIHNNTLSVPKQETRIKPPPPPRRSKSYERPPNIDCSPDIQKNFEEYDLSFMDNERSHSKQVKRVSFQDFGTFPIKPLQRIPSFPLLASGNLFTENGENLNELSKVPLESSEPLENSDHMEDRYHSIKSDSIITKKLEPSTLENLQSRVESSSVIGKLLSDSFIAGKDCSFHEMTQSMATSTPMKEIGKSFEQDAEDDCKYYF